MLEERDTKERKEWKKAKKKERNKELRKGKKVLPEASSGVSSVAGSGSGRWMKR